MSQPTKKSPGGHSQLAVWIPTELKNEIARLASIAGEKQVATIERALRAYVDAQAAAGAQKGAAAG